MNNLLLFSDTFPYGMAEPFLQQELPYLASRFSKVEIVPLYLPEAAAEHRQVRQRAVQVHQQAVPQQPLLCRTGLCRIMSPCASLS